jgi:polysaccharide export outer membrane protein
MTTMRTLILSLAFGLFAFALPAAAQQPSGAAQTVLTPGDSVRIVVWRKPEFSGDFVIAPDGTITHPLFRSVKIAGLPFAKAESNLRTFLSQFEDNPQFVMEPLIRLAVSGEVERPSVFATRPETNVGEALARAGGLTKDGANNRIRLLRLSSTGQQETFLLNLSDVKSSQATLALRSGDQIIVDRKRSFFKDFLIPALGIVGSIASLGLLVDRINRTN